MMKFNFFKYGIRYIQNSLNRSIWTLFNNSNKIKAIHLDWVAKRNYEQSKDFVPISNENFCLKSSDTKLITFYLPQYYENDVNNENFGKGFMEWYNVAKCIPQYTGHNQPQLPIDVGFYDLTHDDIMYRQIELAKKYGIYGFCFYYYWFSGERLLDKPLDNFLANKDLNMPFCLFWANETWSHTWQNGDATKIIKKQELNDHDDEKFAADLIRYFKDKRYIKINGKPLLIVYKYDLFEETKFKTFLKNIIEKIKRAGFEGIYILTTDVGHHEVDISGFEDIEGVVEFCHQDMIPDSSSNLLNMQGKYVNPNFTGRIIDTKKMLQKNQHLKTKPYKLFKSPAAGWDNSPRKAYSNATIYHMCPSDFKKWLSDDIKWAKKHLSENEQFVFIDSWNEWAEGAHLEPDQYYGYAYLQAVKDALKENRI